MAANKMKKGRKYRGSKTHGCGIRKKRRGAGNRGGRGRAGWQKHKWTKTVLDMKFVLDRRKKLKAKPDNVPTINLTQVNYLAHKSDAKELDLSDYKVLGRGNLTKKITIKAMSFSATAMEKIKNAGGVAKPLLATEEPTPEVIPEEEPAAEEKV